MIKPDETKRFIGGCADGEDATGFNTPTVVAHHMAGYDVAIKQDTYERQEDGNYRCIKTGWLKDIGSEGASDQA